MPVELLGGEPLPSLSPGWQWYQHWKEKSEDMDFLGGPVVKTPHSQCRAPGFNSCLGNWISYAATKDPAHGHKDPECCS